MSSAKCTLLSIQFSKEKDRRLALMHLFHLIAVCQQVFRQRWQAVGEFEQVFHSFAWGCLAELLNYLLQGRRAAVDFLLRQRIHGQARF